MARLLVRKMFLWGLLGSILLILLYLLDSHYAGGIISSSETRSRPQLGTHYLKSRYYSASIGTTIHYRIIPSSFPTGRAPNRYVLGLNYWEQMNMALGNMFALAALSKAWRAGLVQPFTHNSRLYGLPHFLADHYWRDTAKELPLSSASPHASLDLDELFDVAYMNKVGSSYDLPQLVPFSRFLETSTRSLILVHFLHERESRETSVLQTPGGIELIRRLGNNHTLECSGFVTVHSLAQSLLSSLNKEAERRGLKRFRLARHCCVNGSHETTPTELAEGCGFDPTSDEDVSLLVMNWRGMGAGQGTHHSAKGYHKSQRLLIKNATSFRHPKGITDAFPHSQKVLRLAEKFTKRLQLAPGGYVGVHLRTEKLGQRNKRINGFLYNCMNQVLEICNNLTSNNKDIPIVFITDYGRHGSDSCHACKGAKKVKQFFNTNNITEVAFNSSNYTVSSSDTGIIAAVEMQVIVNSKIAVLAGGGAFEKQIALLRERTNRNKEFVKVCWDDAAEAKTFIRS